MRCDEPRLVLTSLTTTHQGTRGKGIFCEGGWRGKGERAKVDIEVDPQRRRFGRRESNFCSSVLDRRPRGENGTCPSCVAILADGREVRLAHPVVLSSVFIIDSFFTVQMNRPSGVLVDNIDDEILDLIRQLSLSSLGFHVNYPYQRLLKFFIRELPVPISPRAIVPIVGTARVGRNKRSGELRHRKLVVHLVAILHKLEEFLEVHSAAFLTSYVLATVLTVHALQQVLPPLEHLHHVGLR